MDWKEWIGKRVFIKTISGSIFSHTLIEDVDDSSLPIFIKVTDKFGDKAIIISSEIKIIREEKE